MKQLSATALLVGLFLAALAVAKPLGESRSLTGTLTCLTCDLQGSDGSKQENCEALGHKHCLRLDNGSYVFLLENERSATLLKGGTRHDVKVTVKGTYYPKAHTIDVASYVIDGRTTSWCSTHQRMDLCGDANSKSAEGNTENK